jgi:hypothetical protein
MPEAVPGVPTILRFDGYDNATWSLDELIQVERKVGDVGKALAEEINRINGAEGSSGEQVTYREAFLQVYQGPVTFIRWHEQRNLSGWTISASKIRLYGDPEHAVVPYFVEHPGVIVHELGHALNNVFDQSLQYVPNYLLRPLDGDMIDDGNPGNEYFGYAGSFSSWQFGRILGDRGSEEFADMFVGWVYGAFHSGSLGNQRREYMDDLMSSILSEFGH